MRKQHAILLSVTLALFGALSMASCQPTTATSGSASGDQSASADAAASSAADLSDAASASADVAAAEGSVDAEGFKSIPATIPADHAGRTADQCPTCHVEGGAAPAIPEDHFVDGELDVNRMQCFTCHLSEA